jgi:capsular polysaccharide biosynthesis protein
MGLQPRASSCRNDIHVRQFGNDMVRGLGLKPRAESTCGKATTDVLFVRRVHYVAHPRHNGQIVRRLDNEDEIMSALEAQTAGGEAGVNILNGVFSSMTMKEQVQMAQDACVMTGAHGAGLSHILFSPPGVHMLELQPPAFRRPHFVSYSFWTGAHHHMWALDSSTPSVHSVVTRVLETAQHAATEVGKEGGGDGHAGADHPLHMA